MPHRVFRRGKWAISLILAAVFLGCAWLAFWNAPDTAPTLPAATPINTGARATSFDVAPTALSTPITAAHAKQSIRGTVWHDPRHQKPVPGAFVWARNCRHPFNETGAKTDEKGAFVLQARVPEAAYALLAVEETTGLISLENTIVEVGKGQNIENIDLVLGPGGRISGHVFAVGTHVSSSAVDGAQSIFSFLRLSRKDVEKKEQKPLPGYEVTVTGKGYLAFKRTVKTDGKGAYAFLGLPPGAYSVTATSQDHAEANGQNEMKPVKLTAPEAMQADHVDFLFRAESFAISGQVTDSRGQPLPGAEILVETIFESESGGDRKVAGNTSAICDKNGRYRVSNLRIMDIEGAQIYRTSGRASTQHIVRARMPGYAAIEIALPALNKPLLDAVDAIGRKAVELGMAGSVSIRPGTIPQLQGDRIVNVDFELIEAATVSGTLIDRQNKPVAKKMLYLQPVGETPSEDLCVMRPVKTELAKPTDAEGRFSFESVPAGAYTFYMFGPVLNNRPNRLDADNPPLNLPPGAAITDYAVSVEGGGDRGDICGAVLDAATRSPLADFSISLSFDRLPEASAAQKGELIRPDSPNGEFTLRGVSPGMVTLRAEAESYALAVQQCRVQAGMQTKVVLLMRKGGTIQGSVSVNGQPFAGALINVYTGEEAALKQAVSDNVGRFILTDLLPGNALVVAQVTFSEKIPGTRMTCSSAIVESGAVSAVELAIEGLAALSGVFAFPASCQTGIVVVREAELRGTPLPLNDRAEMLQQCIAETTLSQSGDYVLEGLPPGNFVVTCASFNLDDSGEKTDVREASCDIHIKPGEGESLTLDLELD